MTANMVVRVLVVATVMSIGVGCGDSKDDRETHGGHLLQRPRSTAPGLLGAVLLAAGLARGFATGARGFVVRVGKEAGADASGITLGSVFVADAVALGGGGTLGASVAVGAIDALTGSTGTALSAVSALAGADGGFRTKYAAPATAASAMTKATTSPPRDPPGFSNATLRSYVFAVGGRSMGGGVPPMLIGVPPILIDRGVI